MTLGLPAFAVGGAASGVATAPDPVGRAKPVTGSRPPRYSYAGPEGGVTGAPFGPPSATGGLSARLQFGRSSATDVPPPPQPAVSVAADSVKSHMRLVFGLRQKQLRQELLHKELLHKENRYAMATLLLTHGVGKSAMRTRTRLAINNPDVVNKALTTPTARAARQGRQPRSRRAGKRKQTIRR